MNFTRKKKQHAISENLVNAHALAKATLYSLHFVKENIGLLEPEMREAIKQLVPKLRYFTTEMDYIFARDERASKFIEGSFNALDEYSMRIIEATEQILKD